MAEATSCVLTKAGLLATGVLQLAAGSECHLWPADPHLLQCLQCNSKLADSE